MRNERVRELVFFEDSIAAAIRVLKEYSKNEPTEAAAYKYNDNSKTRLLKSRNPRREKIHLYQYLKYQTKEIAH